MFVSKHGKNLIITAMLTALYFFLPSPNDERKRYIMKIKDHTTFYAGKQYNYLF